MEGLTLDLASKNTMTIVIMVVGRVVVVVLALTVGSS
eukprot:CAMPEP_0195023346 /NCGR_PEP_ID=MMETSP0326_2-20130528/42652_1 /TAXON_ID=2866 ORGANISM="Crypthecodinium cohnii, Strain Seligo" /NCGR_SAMPLE_ID=MMETSP0326_2 /ASSEMBLY_ACC=CAM_ASM_000348 /LENGTH=36 /DNA_ID= /DNA_START= /DNA_END= /DNA_ORIENTATION=